jgi:hypothetical protein
MGVGDSWSFEEISFALDESFPIDTNIFYPNPLGFLALKGASYIDDPSRVRDLVDIVDVVFDLVTKGLHFDLHALWTPMYSKFPIVAGQLKAMITSISNSTNQWDFGRADQEFLQRGYKPEALETEAPRIFCEFLDILN